MLKKDKGKASFKLERLSWLFLRLMKDLGCFSFLAFPSSMGQLSCSPKSPVGGHSVDVLCSSWRYQMGNRALFLPVHLFNLPVDFPLSLARAKAPACHLASCWQEFHDGLRPCCKWDACTELIFYRHRKTENCIVSVQLSGSTVPS